VTVAAGATQKSANLLFVDDEPRVLNSMRAMFRRDYNVFLADSGERALALLDTQAIDVIVSDQRMPSMTGVEVLREVKQRAPRAMRILLTGYADLQAIEASINEGEVFRYLMKPCPMEQLRETVALAVEAAGGHAPAPARSPAAEPTPMRAPRKPLAAASVAAPRAAPKPRPAPHRALREDRVEVLVLSNDQDLTSQLERALHGARTWHKADSVESAVALLESRPIGVLLTDAAVDERAVRDLTASLKRHVPQLVTIVASDRSDAQTLIELINYGQIFRFLLKPFHPGQCRLWVDSAVRKHLELVANPATHSRHVVASGEEHVGGGMMHALLARVRQIRRRFAPFEQAG